MSIQINIGGTIIEFPSSAQSPNWAPALIEFAQTVEAALGGIVGPYDISPQVMDILNDGAEHAIQTPAASLAFPTAAVRAVNIRYSVYRTFTGANPTTQTHAESGMLTVVYNTANASWEIQRDFTGNITPVGGAGTTTSGITFRVDSAGQVYYSAATLSPTGYIGKLSFAAQALLQTN